MTKNWRRRIRSTIKEKQMKRVLCVKEDSGKTIVFSAISLSQASFFTKTSIRYISEILAGKRENKRQWKFYANWKEYANPTIEEYDCPIHKVNLAPGASCPLCAHEQKMSLIKKNVKF